jgi:hypothetical protein
MISPIVTEITPRPEAVTRDSFIEPRVRSNRERQGGLDQRALARRAHDPQASS